MRHLWIVELWNKDCKRWEPTVGAHLSRRDARREMEYDWRYNNPHDKFRVVKYVPDVRI